MASSQAKEVLNKFAAKRTQHKRLFLIVYTIILVVAIFMVWVSLLGPLVVGGLSSSSLKNISRPYVRLLNGKITNDTSILPQNVVQEMNL